MEYFIKHSYTDFYTDKSDVLFLLWSQGNKLFLSKIIKIVICNFFLFFGFVFYI